MIEASAEQAPLFSTILPISCYSFIMSDIADTDPDPFSSHGGQTNGV